MQSLRGFSLQQFVSGENADRKKETQIHPVRGNSIKIGCSFVCHVVLKELKDVHFVISLNEHNQVRWLRFPTGPQC